ncbi:MAG: magnesium transporter [Microthrixaceae bacterium]|nr:magnesium transporter [Microthrixaceae bacterium]
MARRPRLRWVNLAPARLARRLVDLLGPTGGAARQSLVALGFNSLTSFVAGATLVGILPTFQRLPGLLVLVTPAIGLRGNVFSTLGNRLSTTIHAGTFSPSLRRESILGQNLLAGFSLTTFMSVILAFLAKIIAVAVGIPHTISLLDLMLISVLGGTLASVPVALATLVLARSAVRFGWDLDNLVAPTVGTLGDGITIPALWLAATLVGHGKGSQVAGAVVGVAAIIAVVWVFRSPLEQLNQIVRESIPVLGVALLLSALGGLVLQKQVEVLAALPAILLLQPAFVSTAGALGGILCGRVATNLHLGSVEPTLIPGGEVRRDTSFLLGLTVPIFVFNAVGAWSFSAMSPTGRISPGWWWILLIALVAAALTMLFVVAISYYATIGAWRIEVDPDSYGIPVVTAATDFIGTVILVVTVVVLGLA